MSTHDTPFDIPDHAIALDISGQRFTLRSHGPMFVYPAARTELQAQHIHSLWLRWHTFASSRIDPNDKDVTQSYQDYINALEIIVLANSVGLNLRVSE